MNHNEPGFLQATIEGRRSSEIPVRALVRQKGKHPFPKASSDAYAEQKIHGSSHRWHTFQACTFQINRGLAGSLGRDVLFTGFRSIRHWRIAD
jgi:hypothetical protein